MFTDSQSLSILKKSFSSFPDTLMVLGSGWNKVVEGMVVKQEIPFETLFGTKATVPGHEGKLIIGKLDGKKVAIMSGRFHTYEGYSAYEATTPIRVFSQMGVKNLILTAACGALNQKYKVGDFVILNDVVTLFLSLDNPLIGPKFIDVSEVFDADLRNRALKAAIKYNLPFHEGSYAYYHGPNYETPADKMALRILGADVVGMSMVPETLVARSLNIKTLGLAFVTNLAFVKHDHKEVLIQANKAGERMKELLTRIVN